MKRVWKPLDVRGYRLYDVVVSWPKGSTETRTVAAESPSHAAKLIKQLYEELPDRDQPTCFGKAKNILMPSEWWDGPETARLPCEHDWSFVQGMDSTGRHEHVFCCLKCGAIEVRVRIGIEIAKVEFNIEVYEHLAAVLSGAKARGRDLPEALKTIIRQDES